MWSTIEEEKPDLARRRSGQILRDRQRWADGDKPGKKWNSITQIPDSPSSCGGLEHPSNFRILISKKSSQRPARLFIRAWHVKFLPGLLYVNTFIDWDFYQIILFSLPGYVHHDCFHHNCSCFETCMGCNSELHPRGVFQYFLSSLTQKLNLSAMIHFNTGLTVIFLRYLLADEAEAAVFSGAFKGFTQNWVKGLVAVSEGRSGVTRNSEGSNIYL